MTETDPQWVQWGRVTRFLHSANLAFTREATLWTTLEIAEPETLTLVDRHGTSLYSVSMPDHVAAVEDRETLYAAVLTASYAIVEATAADRLQLDSRNMGGIEDWGTRLLATVSKDWLSVFDERAGAVEVAVARNAYAHGARAIDRRAAGRLADAASPWTEGALPVLDYDQLQIYRARLRSLLRQGTTQGRTEDQPES